MASYFLDTSAIIKRYIPEPGQSLIVGILYSLRAYDAIQLACLLRVRDKALLNQASAPIFVCADTHLCTVALIEGLSVENPINYP